MAEVVARAREPALAAIKLAWWREQLEKLDHEPAPAEPRLQAVAAELLPRGIKGAEVAELEVGWATLLEERPQLELIQWRGAALFELAGRLLGGDDPELAAAGQLYALMDVTRRGVRDLRSAAAPLRPHRFRRRLRPLTAVARLAERDLRRGVGEPEGTPGRAWVLLRHRLTGR